MTAFLCLSMYDLFEMTVNNTRIDFFQKQLKTNKNTEEMVTQRQNRNYSIESIIKFYQNNKIEIKVLKLLFLVITMFVILILTEKTKIRVNLL